MVKKLVILVIMTLTLLSNVFGYSDNTVTANNNFIDTSNHWAKEEINMLFSESIIQGYEDGNFKPNNYITISEFLKIVIELGDYKLVTIGNKWPDWYINTAIENKLIYKNEYVDYSKQITRGQAAVIIARYINLDGVNKSKNIFTDLNSNEKDTILKLVKLNVISGYSDNTFRSNNNITRGETCKLLLNAYYARQELLKTRVVDLTSEYTNIKDNLQSKNDIIPNQYEIKNNRIYIYDTGRYAYLNGQTLNQEYINDRKIIKVLETLIGEDSYTELKFVPDKYIINSVNICYGRKLSTVTNGEYIFDVKFYENSYYDVSSSKDEKKFMNDAVIRIRTGKMWDKQFDIEKDSLSSSKNLYKLQETIGILLDDNVKKDFIEYISEKRIEANNIPNSELPKIVEKKQIGKYIINTFCMNNNELEIYIKKF